MTDWSTVQLMLKVLALTDGGSVVGDVWLPLPASLEVEGVESEVMAMFGEPTDDSSPGVESEALVRIGWFFPGDRLGPLGLPTENSRALVVPCYVATDGTSIPAYVADVVGLVALGGFAEFVGSSETDGEGLAGDAELSDQEDPLEAISRVLGTDSLGGALRMRFRSDTTIDQTEIYIGRDGDLLVKEIIRDGFSSRYESTWRVRPDGKRDVLAHLLRLQFPDGVPFETPSGGVADEIVLRLVAARFRKVGPFVKWLEETGIPFTYNSEYVGGLGSLIHKNDD